MRVLVAALCAAFLPFMASAVELKEGKDWRNCSKDEQCVLIDGMCDKTAVNWQVENQAVRFYAQERKNAKCVERFWRPKEMMARCYMGGCQSAPKQAANSTN